MNQRYTDKFLYHVMTFCALLFFIASVYLLWYNMGLNDESYSVLVNQCAPTQDYLCAIGVISDYNLGIRSYYNVLAGGLCVAAILCSTIVSFILQDKRKFDYRVKETKNVRVAKK